MSRDCCLLCPQHLVTHLSIILSASRKRTIEDNMAFLTDKIRRISLPLYVAAGVFTVGLIILIVGLALDTKCSGKDTPTASTAKLESLSQYCKYSAEAQSIGLPAFLKRVQKAYFDNSPNQVAFDPDVAASDMHEHLKKRYHFIYFSSCAFMARFTHTPLTLGIINSTELFHSTNEALPQQVL